jgi:hypothetical protein
MGCVYIGTCSTILLGKLTTAVHTILKIACRIDDLFLRFFNF